MINVAVEGASDVGLARRVVLDAGRQPGRIIIKGGKHRLDPLLAKYNRAARFEPWVVFRDTDTQCPVTVREALTRHIAELSPAFLLRLVHPMSEGWLLADREGFASHFAVKKSLVPDDPESLQNAKQTLLHLCERSRSRDVREGMVRRDHDTGPLYVTGINEFALTTYNVQAAADSSASLRRALGRIGELPSG